MFGTILGDIIGSPYEFDMGNKSKEFPLFSKNSTFTDDSVMTIAVADAFMNTPADDENDIRKKLLTAIAENIIIPSTTVQTAKAVTNK